MSIDLKDLASAYQLQVLRKLQKQEQRKKRPTAAPELPKPSKYHNKPTERITPSGAVLRFDSQKEARRYDELAMREQAGQIRDLRMQVDFTLQEAYTARDGKRVRAIRYKADFTYRKTESGVLVVEDVKSSATRTHEYIMKRKLMKERLGIDIQEI